MQIRAVIMYVFGMVVVANTVQPSFLSAQSTPQRLNDIYYDSSLGCVANHTSNGSSCVAGMGNVGSYFYSTSGTWFLGYEAIPSTIVFQLTPLFTSNVNYETVFSIVNGDGGVNSHNRWLWALIRDRGGNLYMAKEIDTTVAQTTKAAYTGYKMALWDPVLTSSASAPSNVAADTVYVTFLANGQVKIDEVVLTRSNTWNWESGLLNAGFPLTSYNAGSYLTPPANAPNFDYSLNGSPSGVFFYVMQSLNAQLLLGDSANPIYPMSFSARAADYDGPATTATIASDANLVATRAGYQPTFSSSWAPCTTGEFQLNTQYDTPPERTTQYIRGSANTPCNAAASYTFSQSVSPLGNTFGGAGETLQFTVTNTGTAPLVFSQIALSGADPSDFSESNTCGTSLAVNASCTVNVTAHINKSGDSASLVVTSDATNSPTTVTLAESASK